MNAEFKLQMESFGYSVFEDEGSILAHKDLGDRLLQLDLSDVEQFLARIAPNAQLHAYLSIHALREVENIILRPIGLISHSSQHARHHFSISKFGNKIGYAIKEAEYWARSIDLKELLDSLAIERPDRPSTPQINHLVALALLGNFNILDDYSKSFAQGKKMNFVPMITKEAIDAALDVAYNNYAAKKPNKALHLTTYRAGLGDGCCISRAGGTVTPAACLLGR
jgi:hypothetical protein